MFDLVSGLGLKTPVVLLRPWWCDVVLPFPPPPNLYTLITVYFSLNIVVNDDDDDYGNHDDDYGEINARWLFCDASSARRVPKH